MPVKPEALKTHLRPPLAPLYLISSDETLLVEEACDAVIDAARKAGYTERSVHHVEGSFAWHNLTNDAASMSLFAEKKIIDVRVPAKKLDREASDALRAWLDAAPEGEPDTVLLLRTGRLEPKQRNTAWYKAIDKQGVLVVIWPMSAGQLPRWLEQRARGLGLQVQTDALSYLAERVEGNLLAAAGELEKLVLLQLPQPIGLDDLIAASEDSSRFNTFDLLDAVMLAQPGKVARIVAGMREEGVSVFAVLGALTNQLRRGPASKGLPPQRARMLGQFFERIRVPSQVLAECALVDQQGKGQLPGEAWIGLENLLLRLAGARQLPLPSEDHALFER